MFGGATTGCHGMVSIRSRQLLRSGELPVYARRQSGAIPSQPDRNSSTRCKQLAFTMTRCVLGMKSRARRRPMAEFDPNDLVEEAEELLWQPPGALALHYLHQQGLDNETIRKARLGWAEDVWTSRTRTDGLRQVSGLLVPWFSSDGKITMLHMLRDSRVGPCYIRLYHNLPFCYPFPELIETGRPMILVETEIEALFLAQQLAQRANVISFGVYMRRPRGKIINILLSATPRICAYAKWAAGDRAFAKLPGSWLRVKPPIGAEHWHQALEQIVQIFGPYLADPKPWPDPERLARDQPGCGGPELEPESPTWRRELLGWETAWRRVWNWITNELTDMLWAQPPWTAFCAVRTARAQHWTAHEALISFCAGFALELPEEFFPDHRANNEVPVLDRPAGKPLWGRTRSFKIVALDRLSGYETETDPVIMVSGPTWQAWFPAREEDL